MSAGARTATSTAASYVDRGYLLHKALLTPDLRETLERYVSMPATRGRMSPCRQVPGTLALYGDPVFDSVLGMLTERLSADLGVRLAPTYSYLREYVKGSALDPHRDRPECDHSVTVFVGPRDNDPWPMWVRDRDGRDRAVTIPPGGGLSYRGEELLHWRAPCPSRRHLQVFLHYVDLDGPRADRAYDRRRHLSLALQTPDPATRLQVEAFGVRVVIEDESDLLEDLLRRALPSTVTVRADTTGRGTVVRRYRTRSNKGDGYQIERDGHLVGVHRRREAWVHEVVTLVELDLATLAPRHTFVHAGVVEWRGAAILVPGASGTGKSTLVDALVRAGATYYSDEYAVIDRRGRVHPYPRPLGPEISATTRRRAARAGARPPVKPALVVSTRYDERATEWAPVVTAGARAALDVVDHTLIARDQPARALATARMLCRDAVHLHGPRPDADVTAAALLGLVDEMRSDAAAIARRASVRRNSRPGRATSVTIEPSGESSVKPAPHVRFDDVLSRRDHRRLLRFALSHADAYMQSGLSGPEGPVYDETFRRSRSYFEVSPEMAVVGDVVRSLVPYLRAELGVPWFPVLKYEIQMHSHRHGDFFRAHMDCVDTDNPIRRLSLVYYFFEDPKPFRGGELSLFDRRSTGAGDELLPSATVIDPLDNSLIAFPSDLLHEVAPVIALAPSHDGRPLRHSVSVWVYEDPSPRGRAEA